jgi:glycine C-acetyltransferase
MRFIRPFSTRKYRLSETLQETLNAIENAGTFKRERILTSAQRSHITTLFQNGQAAKNVSVLNFCANNYLGLSDHPKVVERCKSQLDAFGAGLSSVR